MMKMMTMETHKMDPIIDLTKKQGQDDGKTPPPDKGKADYANPKTRSFIYQACK